MWQISEAEKLKGLDEQTCRPILPHFGLSENGLPRVDPIVNLIIFPMKKQCLGYTHLYRILYPISRHTHSAQEFYTWPWLATPLGLCAFPIGSFD